MFIKLTMNRTHIIFKCTSSHLLFMLSIEDTSCIVFIRSFLLIQNYSFLIINLNKGSIKSIHSTYKFVYLSFRSKYFPTVENTTSGLVSVSLFHHLIKPPCILLPSLSTWIQAALNQFTQSKDLHTYFLPSWISSNCWKLHDLRCS